MHEKIKILSILRGYVVYLFMSNKSSFILNKHLNMMFLNFPVQNHVDTFTTSLFMFLFTGFRLPSLRKKLHSLSELNQYSITVFRWEMAYRKERAITS